MVKLKYSISQSDIKQRVKNWAGTTFRNMNEVLVSETESQLVFNYIESSKFKGALGMIFDYPEYTRIVIQMKDGKMKASFYDDGNVFRPGQGTVPSTPSRSQYIKDNFKGKDIIENSGPWGKIRYQSVTDYTQRVKITMGSLEKGVKEKGKEIVADF